MTEIKKLAKKVRQAFEKIAEKEPCIGTDLCGLCARASIQLFLEARRKGMYVGLIAGTGHVYNTYKGHIIDVTATQFGYKEKVLCVPISKLVTGAYNTRHGRIRSVKDLSKKAWRVPEYKINNDREVVRQFVK